MNHIGVFRSLLFIFLTAASCTVLPTEGPSTSEIVHPETTAKYVLVEVDDKAAKILSHHSAGNLSTQFGSSTAADPSDLVGVGDVLSIRLLEAGKQGLFAQSQGGGANFPAVVVGVAGDISLPYVGLLNVVGLTSSEIEMKIVAELEGKAINPQAAVALLKSANNNVTVSGGVFRPGDYPLSLRGSTLAQAISIAGGSKIPDYETRVTVIRDSVKAFARLDRVLLEPQQNIALQRDDLVVLSHEPERYTITGAVARSGLFPFSSSSISVLEAVSRAGGLLDGRADPTGVFLFRFESKRTLNRLGEKDYGHISSVSGRIPTVYRIDFQDASSRFHAQAVSLRDGDALFVSNSDTVQISKVFALFFSAARAADASLTIGK